jgi:hypothetical protein
MMSELSQVLENGVHWPREGKLVIRVECACWTKQRWDPGTSISVYFTEVKKADKFG